MADPLDPGPIAVDPELEASLVRLLSIRGALGALKVLDTIVPVVNMGDVVPSTTLVLQPAYRSTDIFSNGRLTSVLGGDVLADTGQLAAGTFDFKFSLTTNDTVNFLQMFQIEHRNAANAANLAVWSYMVSQGDGAEAANVFESFGYEVSLNERLRVIATNLGEVGRSYACTIFARIR